MREKDDMGSVEAEIKMLRKKVADLEGKVGGGWPGIGMFFSLPGVAVALIDESSLRFVEVSDTFSEIYGYTVEELKGGMGVRDLESERPGPSHVREAGGARVPRRFHRRKDGEVFPVELWAEPCGAGRLCCVVREVSSQGAEDAQGWTDDEMFRLVYENSNDAIGVSFEGVHVMANPAYMKLFGYDRMEELAGVPIFELIAPEEHERVKMYVSLRARGMDAPMQYVTVGMRRDGSKFDMEVRGSIYEHGGRRHTLVLLRDVTEDKKMLEALRRSEERYRALAENVTDMLFSMDAEFRYTLWNHACEEHTGIAARDALGKTLFDIFPDVRGTEIEMAYREVVSSRRGRTLAAEFELQGRKTMFELNIYPAEPGVTVLAKDVTEKRRAEEELNKLRKIESVGMLAGGIAHDFNNTLAVVLSGVDYAVEVLEEDPADAADALGLSRRAIMDAKRLTSQLLTFSRGGSPVIKAGDVGEVLRDTAGFALRGSKSKCRFELPEGLWKAMMDPGQISQVVQNLILNADEAMPGGGTVVVEAANVRLNEGGAMPLAGGAYVRVRIFDTGVGMPAEHLPKIFDPYFTTKRQGQGLGLATAFSVMVKHGGYITAESEHGSGSVFTIYLPAAEGAKEPRAKREGDVGRALKVLLMDDHDHIRELMKKQFSKAGHDAVVSHDGMDAVVKYENALREGRKFDAVILDLTVPGGMGGREAVEKLREIDPDVRAIVASGYFNDPVMAEPDRFGFRGVVGKPYVFTELLDAINGAMDEGGEQ